MTDAWTPQPAVGDDDQWDPDTYRAAASYVPALGVPVLDLLAARRGERVLDLGCGEGSLALELMRRQVEVVGVDSSPEMVMAAVAQGLDARLVDAQRLADGMRPAAFDAVFTNAALHWMTDADGVLRGVRHVLRPGGRFVGEFAGLGNVAAVGVALDAAVRLHGGAPVGNPWFFPTAEEYEDLLEAHGFEVDSVELFPRPTALPAGIEGWIDVFAHRFFESLPAERRADARRDAVELMRPWLCDHAGVWCADYVRLRFAARLPEGPEG